MSVRRFKLQAMIIHAVYSGVDTVGRLCRLLSPVADPFEIVDMALALDAVWNILKIMPEECLDLLDDPDISSKQTFEMWNRCRIELVADKDTVENMIKNLFYKG